MERKCNGLFKHSWLRAWHDALNEKTKMHADPLGSKRSVERHILTGRETFEKLRSEDQMVQLPFQGYPTPRDHR
eukprot:5520347-Amphidinium_carterae.1